MDANEDAKRMAEGFDAALAITEEIVNGMESADEQALRIWREECEVARESNEAFLATLRRLRAEWSKAREPAAEVCWPLYGEPLLIWHGAVQERPSSVMLYAAPVAKPASYEHVPMGPVGATYVGKEPAEPSDVERDARRYRWLRNLPGNEEALSALEAACYEPITPEQFDAAIDAAIKDSK